MVSLMVVSFLIVSGISLLAGLLLLRLWPGVSPERFAARGADSAESSILRWTDQGKSGLQSTLERIGRRVGPKDEPARARYRTRLVVAGYPDPNALLLFIGSKVALALLLGSAYFLYGLMIKRAVPNLLMVSLILAVVGFFAPDFWLRNRTTERQRKILYAFPDVLDLLMICVEAGMGLDAALARVSEQPAGRSTPLHDELRRTQLEVRAGRPRAEAFRDLGARTGVHDVNALMGAFIQTDKLGTPLGRTLRVHADAARLQRRHRAEKQAHLAPLKMLFPTVLFLFPAFFLVTMAPTLLSLLQLLRSMGR